MSASVYERLYEVFDCVCSIGALKAASYYIVTSVVNRLLPSMAG